MNDTNKSFNQSILKAFHLLDAFTSEKKEWGVRELALKTGYNKSTVYRLLHTLVSLNIVYQNPSEKYSLGSKLFELGNRVSLYRSIANTTHIPIKNVAMEIQETVLLGILKEDNVFYINKADSLHGLKINTSIGAYQPLHATASGKLLLAFSSPAEQQQLIDRMVFTPYTSNTITQKTQLKKALQKISKQQYALDLEEFELGLVCIAIPIRNRQQKVIASISASGPLSRFRMENVQNYIAILQKGVRQIENYLQDFDHL